MMKMRKYLPKACFLALAMFLCSFLMVRDNVYASGVATGGGGYTAGNGPTHFNCTLQVAYKHCPQWMIVDHDTYEWLLSTRNTSDNRVLGSYDGLDTCRNDDYVIISAYQSDQECDANGKNCKTGAGKFYMRNITGAASLLPTKESRTLYGAAGYTSSGWSVGSWYWGRAPSKYEWANTLKVRNESYTYGELLDYVVGTLNYNERNLAAFCKTSVVNNYTLTAKLTIDGVVKDYAHNNTVASGDSATVENWQSSFDYDGDTYNFDAWYDANSNKIGTGSSYTEPNMRVNKTVYANYIKKVISYTYILSYDANGGTGAPSPNSCTTTGSSCSVEVSKGTPTRNGYTFLGWADSSSATSAKYEGGDSIALTSNKTVYAVYEKDCGDECDKKEFGSAIDMKIRKLDTSGSLVDAPLTNPLYAKPGDRIELKGTYTPSVQSVANLNAKQVYVGNNNVGSGNVKDRFDTGVSPAWNNAFAITLKNNKNDFSTRAITGTIGSSGSYSSNDVSYTVSISDPGQIVEAQAVTNFNNEVKTSPKVATVSYDANSNPANVRILTDSISDSSYIKVPYNFELEVSVGDDSNDDNNIVYAGTNKSIRVLVDVVARKNERVGSSYATIVRGAKSRVTIIWRENERQQWQYQDFYQNDLTLNENGNSNGVSGVGVGGEVSVPIGDLAAGADVCAQTAIWPADSGAYENIDIAGYTDRWKESGWKCYKVAKNPTFQVWGGNVYSNGGINTSVSKKQFGGQDYLFGSWAELGVIASGKVIGFSSGASLSYEGNSAPRNGNFCVRSLLTLANSDCDTKQEAGRIGSSVLPDSADGLEGNLVEKLAGAGDKIKSLDIVSWNGKSCVGGAELSAGSGVWFANGGNDDLIISGNLTYGGSYSSFDNMPKIVVYAKNIKIYCDVTRIDAVLIAKESVNTCVNGYGNTPDVNDELRSNQLTINGAILAESLELNRTYGAATGANSAIPAEIINFDPTLYMWGSSLSSDSDSSTAIDSVYINELAPRY